jgi:hypothetical protein
MNDDDDVLEALIGTVLLCAFVYLIYWLLP